MYLTPSICLFILFMLYNFFFISQFSSRSSVLAVYMVYGEIIKFITGWFNFTFSSLSWHVQGRRQGVCLGLPRYCCAAAAPAMKKSVSRGPGAKFFFPRQFRTPSTNSFAYSQSELHDMNMNDLRLRNKSTHARGLVILLLSLIQSGPCHWSWTITLVRGN